MKAEDYIELLRGIKQECNDNDYCDGCKFYDKNNENNDLDKLIHNQEEYANAIVKAIDSQYMNN